MLCEVFKSSRRDEMYLYVDNSRGVAEVPQELLMQFGKLVPVMRLLLTPERTLARANVAVVLASLESQGYYLQMPPSVAELQSREL